MRNNARVNLIDCSCYCFAKASAIQFCWLPVFDKVPLLHLKIGRNRKICNGRIYNPCKLHAKLIGSHPSH